MNLNVIKRALGVAVLSVVSMGCFAQDLIAKQAPSDKRMKDVNNVRLHRAASSSVNLDNPAADIYTNWSKSNIRDAAGSVAANYKIDLRGFCMPTPSRKVTSNFGPRWHRQHEGIDVKVYVGDTIRSAFDGKVRMVKWDGRGYGYYVVIRHPNGLETLYGHLSKQIVKEDQIVHAGDPIGLGGNTGRSNGSHLHFETRLLGKPIDPALMFDFERQDVTADFYVNRKGAMTAGKAASRTVQQMDAQETQNTDLASTEGSDEEATATTTAATASNASAKQKKTKSVVHSVKSGDTLSAIARKYGTTVDKLCRLNGISKTSLLHKGQKIKCS